MLERYFNRRRIKKGIEIEDSILTVTQNEKAQLETPFEKKRLTIVWRLIILFIIFLGGRVFYMEFFKGDYYFDVAKNNRIRQIIIKAPRGVIMDKFGKTLAGNAPSIDAVIMPSDLPQGRDERNRIAETLSSVLDINLKDTETIINDQDKKMLDPVLLKENISQDQALILTEKAQFLPGVVLDRTAVRNYADSVIVAPIMGYDGKITEKEMAENEGYLMTDYIGKTGIEKSYEKELRGVYGAKQIEIDSQGNIKRNIATIDPQPGSDLVLNIDKDLQKKIYDSLSAILEKTQTKTAAVVAIDPRNGAILAMISLPSYDNNLFAQGISGEDYNNIINNKDLPLLNRVTSGEYPPGSTLKPAVAAAALMEGTIDESTVLNCPGSINIGSWAFRDWKTHGGGINVKKAIAESCDVFFYAVGGGYGNITGLGMSRMKKYENLFGLGSPTGVDLPNESKGFIPDENWKLNKLGEKWYIGDSYHCAIGQGFVTATPLQLANYIAAIANGGTLYSPRIVNRVKKADGQEEVIASPVIRKNFISQKILNIIRDGMRQTITSGTAQSLNSLPIEAAGKTGTAQYGSDGKTHAWFVSFAPYDNPTIAMAVLVEGGGEGSSSAVPVTRDVYQWYFSPR